MKAGNVPRTAIRLTIRAYNGNWKASVGSLENLDIANELSLRLWSEKVTGDTGCALLRFDRGPRITRVAAIIGESIGDCFWLPQLVVVVLVEISGRADTCVPPQYS